MNSASTVTLQRRIERKLHYRYLRRLSRHHPEHWAFSEGWRTFTRTNRRRWNRFWNRIAPARLFNALRIMFVVCVCLGLAVAITGATIWLLIYAAPMVLLATPPRFGEPSVHQLAAVAFSRLTILQSFAWIGIVLVGIRSESAAADSPEQRFVRRHSVVKQRVRSALHLSVASFCLAVVGSAICTWKLPCFWSSFLAAVLISLSLNWSSFWMSRWGGQNYVPNQNRVVLGFLSLALIPIVLLTIGLFWGRPVTGISADLAWLGPAGWFNHQALQIGVGRVGRWLSLLIALAGLCSITAVVRSRVKTWMHRRRTLELTMRRPDVEAKSPVFHNQRNADLRSYLREEIRCAPKSWSDWIWPSWLAERRWLFWITVAGCLGTQCFAVFMHSILASLEQIPTVGDSRPGFDHVVRWVALSSLIVGTFAIEGLGLAYRDLIWMSHFAERPVSPWGLWKQIQWFGLLRIPLVLLYAVPFLPIPYLLIEGSRWLPFLTLGLSIATLFAIRTSLVAGVVYSTSCSFLPPWVGLITAWPLTILWIALLVLGVAATLPEDSGFAAVFRQGLLQMISLSLLGVATGFWQYVSRCR